jgi:hypothetical protein
LPADRSTSVKAPTSRSPARASFKVAPPHVSPNVSRRSCMNASEAKGPPADRLSTISSSSSA